MTPQAKPSTEELPPPLTLSQSLRLLARWVTTHPLESLLLLASAATMVYFFGFYYAFRNGLETTALWASRAWNSENNQEHSWLILPITAFLLWYHRDALRAAPKQPSNLGILFLIAGVGLFVAAVRMIDARTAVVAFPVIIFGAALFLWGTSVARIFIFPCLFMLFMVPVGGLVQGTVGLQLLVSSSVKFLSTLIGVHIQTVGTTLRATDGSFNFDIAEGCSGIRSLMAMITLSALYVHFNVAETWKQWTIFAGSVVFALIGNIGRVFSEVIVARFIDEKIAGGLYHDYSGFIFFPFAVGAMIGFSKLLNTDWKKILDKAAAPERPAKGKKTADPISYDY
ncbi:MAG: exosortase/archaeosortase family protein [Verrucomicrobia bacterium]|nr:exosortase/archaeosortase family protein [Verrucomicrobiota bacterium]